MPPADHFDYRAPRASPATRAQFIASPINPEPAPTPKPPPPQPPRLPSSSSYLQPSGYLAAGSSALAETEPAFSVAADGHAMRVIAAARTSEPSRAAQLPLPLPLPPPVRSGGSHEEHQRPELLSIHHDDFIAHRRHCCRTFINQASGTVCRSS